MFEEDASKLVFGGTRVAHRFRFLVGPVLLIVFVFGWSYYVFLRSEFRVVMSITISTLTLCSVRLYLQLVVGGLMSCLRCLCLFSYSGVQHILCCVFALFFFVLCTLCCQFLLVVLFWLPLRYSLTFILSYPLVCLFDDKICLNECILETNLNISLRSF